MNTTTTTDGLMMMKRRLVKIKHELRRLKKENFGFSLHMLGVVEEIGLVQEKTHYPFSLTSSDSPLDQLGLFRSKRMHQKPSKNKNFV